MRYRLFKRNLAYQRKKKLRKKSKFVWNFQTPFVGAPVGRSGWLIARFSPLGPSFKPVPDLFFHLKVDVQSNVSKVLSKENL